MTLPALPFFVYGTLRPGEPNHTALLLGRTLGEWPARLSRAVLYEGPGYPYAVGSADGHVHGDLVVVRPEHYGAVLAELDELEEYRAGDPDSLYVRVVREVVREGEGGGVRAWVYLAGDAVAGELAGRGRVIPGGDWVRRGDRRRPV